MQRKREQFKRFQSLGDVLIGKTPGNVSSDLVSLYRIQQNWENTVGKEIALRTFAKEIRGKTLVISVENPAWSQQLSMMKETILEVIVKREEKNISKLQFVTEKIPPKNQRKKPESKLPEVERTEPVQDEDLQSSLARIRKLQEDLQKNRR